jgi:hypothetical protein
MKFKATVEVEYEVSDWPPEDEFIGDLDALAAEAVEESLLQQYTDNLFDVLTDYEYTVKVEPVV